MKIRSMLALLLAPLLAGVVLVGEPLRAQQKPVVAVIGTGNLASIVGPAMGRAGYPVVYGSRTPERDSVRALVRRTGANASAATTSEAAARAQVILLAVPSDVVVSVSSGLALDGKIVLDVSSGRKRVAADGYLELDSDSSLAELIQARRPGARVVRMNLPSVAFFNDPMLVGTRPSVLLAGNASRAKEVVARIIFDVGLDPHDAGPLRFARVFDAVLMMNLIPGQRRRPEAYDLKLLPSTPWSCFFDATSIYGTGRPYDLDSLTTFPRREPLIPCEEWRRRVKF